MQLLPRIQNRHPIIRVGKYLLLFESGRAGERGQPYRIGRVLQYPDRVTVEIIHRVMGKNCLCDASSMAAAAAVSIPRVDQRIDYIIKPEEGASCQYLPSTRSTNPRGSPYQLPPAGVPMV